MEVVEGGDGVHAVADVRVRMSGAEAAMRPHRYGQKTVRQHVAQRERERNGERGESERDRDT